jgi:hypothetical protein
MTIEERRQMASNLPNLIRIISAEWRTWIARAKTSKGGGFKKVESTDTGELSSVKNGHGLQAQRGIRRRERARSSFDDPSWGRR